LTFSSIDGDRLRPRRSKRFTTSFSVCLFCCVEWEQLFGIDGLGFIFRPLWSAWAAFLKSGQQVSAKLPQAGDCRFDLRGTFDDGESMAASGINVCADKKINLAD
jgi:hypothetical protein